MAMEEKGTFGLLGRSWEVAKIYQNSNLIKQYGGIIESESFKTLGDFVRENYMQIGVSQDTADAEFLKKYGTVKFIPTRRLSDFKNPLGVHLITYEDGSNIGLIEETKNGLELRLSENIVNYNKNMMERLKKRNVFSKEELEILEEGFNINTVEKLIKKLSKDEELVIEDEKVARSVIKAKYKEKGFSFENDEEQEQTVDEEREDKERRVINNVPEDMRDELFALRKTGARIMNVKLVMSAKQIADRIDNRNDEISVNGGPVLLVEVSYGGADKISNDYVAIQDGKEIPKSNVNRQIYQNIMENYKRTNTIRDLDKTDEQQNPTDKELQVVDNINREREAKLYKARDILLETQEKIDIIQAEGPESYETFEDYKKAISQVKVDAQKELDALEIDLYEIPSQDEPHSKSSKDVETAKKMLLDADDETEDINMPGNDDAKPEETEEIENDDGQRTPFTDHGGTPFSRNNH